MLSVIIPAYNESCNISRSFTAVSDILASNQIPHEILYIDDGSADDTWLQIHHLSQEHRTVRGIRFSRNFGKEAAIFAGLSSCHGDCCVVMDSDLQHPPALIPQMYQLWQEGYEVVEAVKNSRGEESLFHKLSAKLFYQIISRLTGIDMSRASDFKLLDRCAINALISMPERAPFFRALSSWIGFRSTSIPFDVQRREFGNSKWNYLSLIKYAIRNISSFSGSPMQIVTVFGYIMLLFAFFQGIEALHSYFTGTAATGFTTVILLQLIIGSMLMISLGIIGHYISCIYDEIKARPRYIISTTCGTSTTDKDTKNYDYFPRR